MFDHPWRKVYLHVSGKCDHDISTDSVDDSEVLVRFTVFLSDCEELRSEAHEVDTLLDLSKQVDWDCQTVLRHVRGRCDHDGACIDPVPAEMDRSENVSIKVCEQMRDAYFDERLSLSKVAEDFGASTGTAERHIKFNCGHENTS